jgi:uncharacterized protein (DUF1778 family)
VASQSSRRSARIEARIAPEALATVRRAAELQGRSVSDFMVSAAHDAAQHVIESAHIIRLSLEDQDQISNLLANPSEPKAALKRAFEAHRDLIRSDK